MTEVEQYTHDICPSCRKPMPQTYLNVPHCSHCDRTWNRAVFDGWNAGYRAGKGLENLNLEEPKKERRVKG